MKIPPKFKVLMTVLGLLSSSSKIVRFIKYLARTFFAKKQNLHQKYGTQSYALITGGNDYFGKEIAYFLSSLGFNIILIAKDRDSLIKTINNLRMQFPKQDFKYINLDISKIGNDCDNFNHAMGRLQNIDISMIINTAEMDQYEAFDTQTPKNIKKMINVNNMAPILIIKSLLPQLKARKNKSAIINLSFGACKFPMAYYGSFLGTKLMINQFTRSLAIEYPNIDILLFTPFEVNENSHKDDQQQEEGGSNKSQANNGGGVTIKDSVQAMFNDLGHVSSTNGHWKHKLQAEFYKMIPKWLFKTIYHKVILPNIQADRQEKLKRWDSTNQTATSPQNQKTVKGVNSNTSIDNNTPMVEQH